MKSSLTTSHAAMLSFIEKLIENSGKFAGRTPSAQKNYDKAKKLAANARAARDVAIVAGRVTRNQN